MNVETKRWNTTTTITSNVTQKITVPDYLVRIIRSAVVNGDEIATRHARIDCIKLLRNIHLDDSSTLATETLGPGEPKDHLGLLECKVIAELIQDAFDPESYGGYWKQFIVDIEESNGALIVILTRYNVTTTFGPVKESSEE